MLPPVPTYAVLSEVEKERARQNEKWGEQNHNPEFWLAILGEEFGEVARAICEHKPRDYRHELIQLAAVAVAMVESFDRQPQTLIATMAKQLAIFLNACELPYEDKGVEIILRLINSHRGYITSLMGLTFEATITKMIEAVSYSRLLDDQYLPAFFFRNDLEGNESENQEFEEQYKFFETVLDHLRDMWNMPRNPKISNFKNPYPPSK